MKKNIALLGATGSIGDSTLDIIRLHADKYRVYALSGFGQVDKLFELCQEFRPVYVAVSADGQAALSARLADAGIDTQVVAAPDGLTDLAGLDEVDIVVAAIVGAAGLASTLKAVQSGKTVLLANKESLVMAGHLVMATARRTGAVILPIDSEHNAIYQCLPHTVQQNNQRIGDDEFGIKRLWLTASGGGFLHKSIAQMQSASVQDAITHPNWSMGKKISIDSATMMNKGLELIEACHLFALDESKIDIVIHPNSVVHSLVEYVDGSFLAQLGTPDMKTPIAHALAYPTRINAGVQALDLCQLSALTFVKPDLQKFKSLTLARRAVRLGTGACITLNAANEVAVSAFLDEKIRLTDIADVVQLCLEDERLTKSFGDDFATLDDIMQMDKQVRVVANDHVVALGQGGV